MPYRYSTPRAMTRQCVDCSLIDTCGVDQSGLMLPLRDIEDGGFCPLLESPHIPPDEEMKGYLIPEADIDDEYLNEPSERFCASSLLRSANSNSNATGPPTSMPRSSRDWVSERQQSDASLGQDTEQGQHNRDSSEDSSVIQSSTKPPATKEIHRLTEKRYRANLNDKIQALRDVLPQYRPGLEQTRLAGSQQEAAQKRRAARRVKACKHNKGAILTEAIAYIRMLERRIEKLEGSGMRIVDGR